MTESLDESHKLNKGLNFGSVIFMNLYFGSDFSWYLFFGYPKNTWSEPPCHVYVRVHSLGSYLGSESILCGHAGGMFKTMSYSFTTVYQKSYEN